MRTQSFFRKNLTSVLMPFMVIKGTKSLRHMEEMSHHPYEDNEELLKKIIRENKDTEFGRNHHFDRIHSLEDFRKSVPLSLYEDYEPYIDRIRKDEPNLLTNAPVIGYSRTSGSSGKPKFIPATLDSLNSYTKYTWTRALALAARNIKDCGKKYKAGRGLYGLPSVDEYLPNGSPCSNIAEIAAQHFGFVYPYILTLPGGKMFNIRNGDYRYCIYRFALEDEDTSFMFCVFLSMFVSQIEYLKQNWKTLVEDIELGRIDERIPLKPEVRKSLLKSIHPMPERAAYLRRQFETGFDSTILKRIWPNLSLICGIGSAAFCNAAEKMKQYAEGISFDYSIYGASEGLIAACYRLNSTDMQLLTDSCFFEFLPENEESSRLLTLDQLEKGKRYEVIITTQSGLFRYRLKDIIEVVGFRNRCPLISFSYRRGQLLNLAGEKFTEENARNVISIFEKRYRIDIPHWIFCEDNSVSPSRYNVLMECDAALPGDAEKKLEEVIGECNHRYTFQKEKHDIGDLIISLESPGTHDAWREHCVSMGAFPGQVKEVHTLDNCEKRDFFLKRIEK